MIEVKINGVERRLDVEPDMPLLWALRDELKLTGTKFGCGVAACGACTVHLNGAPVRSCQTFMQDVDGGDVTTIEGVDGRAAAAVQAAWTELNVPQCGYCQSGQIMSAVALLSGNASPSHDDIDSAMQGNICRCASYARIRKAIMRASEIIEA